MENTRLLYLESPGSLTFELQDLPAMTILAKKHNIITICDNTWGTALHYPVLELGVDIVVEAATKYIAGHSDVNLGIAAANGSKGRKLRTTARNFGICAGPERLVSRAAGLTHNETSSGTVRSKWTNAGKITGKAPLVLDVLHPALESSPDHELYKRDFSGSCGLFGFVLPETISQDRLDNAVEAMDIFAIGDSVGAAMKA